MPSGIPHRTAADVERRLAELGRTDVALIQYAGKGAFPSTWRCLRDGTVWEARAHNILSGRGCPTCAPEKQRQKCREREARRREARALPVGVHP